MIVSRRAFLQISAVLGAAAVLPLKLVPEHPEFVEIADEHLVIPELNIWCTSGNEIKGPCLITRFVFGYDFHSGTVGDGCARLTIRRPESPSYTPFFDEVINKRCVFNWGACTPDSELVVLNGRKMLVESPDPDMTHIVYYRRPGPDGKYITMAPAVAGEEYQDDDDSEPCERD